MIGKWVRLLITAFTLPQLMPTRVFGDNLPNEQMANGGQFTNSRHIARKIAMPQEEVRKGEFLFNHVADEHNPSDYLTKWVPPKKRRKSTAYIFNQRNAIRPLCL